MIVDYANITCDFGLKSLLCPFMFKTSDCWAIYNHFVIYNGQSSKLWSLKCNAITDAINLLINTFDVLFSITRFMLSLAGVSIKRKLDGSSKECNYSN